MRWSVRRPPRTEVSTADLARAARLLVVRGRREVTGLFAGNYASAFRGGGLEFEESRPYAAGDDIRTLDWNATARSGEPFVKRFREERNQTLLFGLDVSASMRFGTTGRAKSATAVHALALVAAAAARAGDRSGLVAFDERIRSEVAVGRGRGHVWSLIRAAVAAADSSGNGTHLAAGVRGLQTRTRERGVVLLFSDFRDPRLLSAVERDGGAAPSLLRATLARLARHHDVIAAVVVDRREQAIPAVGSVRFDDPEAPGNPRIFHTGSRRGRERYERAALQWRNRLASELVRSGAETLWLDTNRSPLHALGRFFRERAERRSGAMA